MHRLSFWFWLFIALWIYHPAPSDFPTPIWDLKWSAIYEFLERKLRGSGKR